MIGFFWNKKKVNDSSFLFKYHLGNRIKHTYIYIGKLSVEENSLLQLEKDTLIVATNEVENFMQSKIAFWKKRLLIS